MLKINYKKMYEDLIFEKINLQKEYDIFKEETTKNNNQSNIKIQELKNNIDELKDKLKKYTAPKRSKIFYENHREEIIKKNKEYIKKNGIKSNRTPEQIKEYNKRAYEKRKLEKKNIKNLIKKLIK